MSSPATLTAQVENLIHDTVCMELTTVDHRELGSLAHSLRVDEAAQDIIALVEQDVARRLLSDEVIDTVHSQLLYFGTDVRGIRLALEYSLRLAEMTVTV